uniref:Programmed cell death protein 4 n=3 Tax=Lygus hesperus TaxID=30085 RepID=A0A0K8TJP3_LYGHE
MDGDSAAPIEPMVDSPAKNELSKSAENLSVDQRLKKKGVLLEGKRIVRGLSKEGLVPNGSQADNINTPRNWKNTRRPRNGFGRGLPKKGGAGGKGVWGKLGSELAEEEDIDRNDPNYDSDSLDNGEIELATYIPEASDEELRKAAEMVILEYYEHGDPHEAILSFQELNLNNKRHYVCQLAVEIALDHKPSHREMTSVLISDMYGTIAKQNDIANAFDSLISNLPDLILDTPDAPTVLGNFLARAIADDCIPPKLITVLKGKAETELARQTLARADTLLSMKHGLVRLDNVWGVGGGLRPVKYLIRKMNLLLQEYISSSDLKEATRCLLDLEVPHFHHELVYEAVIMVLEAMNANVEDAMCKLLKSLSDAVIITPDMMSRGFIRVFDDMPDIVLDVPLAGTILERFVSLCQKEKFISDDLVRKMPCRGRKRFVSEGDGGRIKEVTH